MDYKNYILDMLYNHADECLKEPRWGLPKGYFENRSYARWAANEVLRAIDKYEGDPEEAIELFMSKMDKYACQNQNSGMIFSIAHDVAVWMLDLLLAFE